MKPYFIEIPACETYSNAQDDFHFSYNGNSGSGQAYLAGKYYNTNGELCSSNTLNGKTAVLMIRYIKDGEQKEIAINSNKVKYKILPRGNGEKSVRLEMQHHANPFQALSTFMMLPLTCTARGPKNLDFSVLNAGNYWLTSMWMKCVINGNEAYCIPRDFVYLGGSNRKTGRFFYFDYNRRICDIIKLSNTDGIFPKEISEILKYFASIYLGQQEFDVEPSADKINSLMNLVVSFYPAYYSGLSDPLPALVTIFKEKRTIVSSIPSTQTYKTDLPRNLIIFGAPGTGKTFYLNKKKDELISNEDDYERITFYPDYSYANFVGTYKPIPYIDKNGDKAITYSFIPGPFMRLFTKALENSQSSNVRPFLLIIEEINRANVTSVFGDIFQLLDRNDNGTSEYPIQASEDIKKHLAEVFNQSPDNFKKLYIPDNLFIWATMNSADQGVFPMDTAFKRRWNFKYCGINANIKEIQGKTVVLGKDKQKCVQWNNLRVAINNFLSQAGVNEDKQLGPYFIERKIVVPDNGNKIDSDLFKKAFKNKVIMYLFEDAAKQIRPRLFSGCGDEKCNRYSDICEEFDSNGINIFDKKIVEATGEEIQPNDGKDS